MDIKNNTYYKYDLVIPELKLCIEYNGDLFHANPLIFESEDKPNPFNQNITSNDIWKKDKIKLDLIKSKGYKVLVIWSSDKDKKEKIKDFIKDLE
jgi:G:T-mismatch repair DNA endonuclease (very short patch repair protein)